MPPPDPPNPNADRRPGVTPSGELDRLVDLLCEDVPAPALIVASDFDGTLAPIVSSPGEASALPRSLASLRRLVELGVIVAVISGRSSEALERAVPVAGVRLLGDYGLDHASPAELEALAALNEAVAAEFGDVDGVVVEPKPGSTSVHYRRNPEVGPRVYEVLAPLAARLGLRAGRGRMVVEVRPSRADKGLALGRLMEQHSPVAVAFAGDDEGDRSAFQQARSAAHHLAAGVLSNEAPADLFGECDAVVEGPVAWARVLGRIAERFG